MQKNFLRIFQDRRQLEIFLLGICSGMPLMVIFTTLVVWLHDADLALPVITTFAVARIPYSLKPLWAPFVDNLKIPFLHQLGQRKSWMILCILLISSILFSFSLVSPKESLGLTYGLAILLGFVSATFDITFDAFRIERFPKEEQAIAIANTTLGYRSGMVISGVAVLHLVERTKDWPLAFQLMALCYASILLLMFFIKEHIIEREKSSFSSFQSIQKMVVEPFKDFFNKQGAILILLAIILFKLGDAMLGVVSMPFYLQLGFSKGDIANVSKIFGVAATIVGTYAGAMIAYRLGNFKAMIITGIAQNLTNATYIWLNHHPGELGAFYVAIGVENFAGGMGMSVLAAYLSSLCNIRYSATQFALLSSASTLCNNTIVIYGGAVAAKLGWDYYFALTVILGFPAIALLVYLNYRFFPRCQEALDAQPKEVLSG